MSDNPYEAPQSTAQATGVLSGSREDVRKVAQYQKGIIVCILIYLLAVMGQFAVPPELRLFLGLGVFVLGIVGAVFVFLLAMKTYGTALGILLGILSLVPCIGLIVLLVVNGKATNILRQNGIKVGLMGADVSSI
mgnify:CR=1 FL=1